MDPVEPKTTGISGINLSARTWINLFQFFCANLLYGTSFLELIRTPTFESPWDSPPVYFFLFSLPWVFVSLAGLQRMFDVRPDPKIIEGYRNETDGNAPRRFCPVRGFRTFYRYIVPFACYLFFLTFTVYLFVPWIQNGMAHFHYKSSSLFSALLGWIFLSPAAIIIMRSYFVVAAFLEIYPELLVVRKRATTWYLPIADLDRIVFYTRGGSPAAISLKTKGGKEIWFDLRYLKQRTTGIRKCFNELSTVDVKSRVRQRQPVSVSLSDRSRSAPGATGWSRVSRWG